MKVRLEVNGAPREVEVDGPESLLFVLRERLGLTGAKNACEQGECGSCTVVVDDELLCACLVMAASVDGARVTTVEGIADERLHPIQAALVEAGAVQCGFCTPGFVVALAHLLERGPLGGRADLAEALAGNICRCTGYGAILRAVEPYLRETR